jgi:peptidoglycan/LPS O-acetylase OafA/YrhL
VPLGALENNVMLTTGIFRREGHALVGLDVLRGVAIALVLVAHFYGSLMPLTAQLVCANGGVSLFFFLSGFLMDRTFSQEPRLIPYITRRSFRILPMYWFSIAAIFLLDPGWSVSNVITNAFFVAPAVHAPRMSGVYWTLYIEVLFYALVPLLWYSGRRAVVLAPYFLITVYAICLLAGLKISAAPFYVLYCLAGMQMGAWKRNTIGGFTVCATLVTIVIASSVLPIVAPWLGLVPFVCASLLWIALRYRVRFALLEVFGNVSYSWYLLHPIVGYPAMVAAHSLGVLGAASFGVAVSFLASALTFAVVEAPLIKAGRVLVREYRNVCAAASAGE